jgi:hypothetical protein
MWGARGDNPGSPTQRDNGGNRVMCDDDSTLIWRSLPYYPRYRFNSRGDVESHDPRDKPGREKWRRLKVVRDLDGYARARLWDKQIVRNIKVCRAVMILFGPPEPFPGAFVLHGPGGNQDDSIDNLRWGTHRENMDDRRRDGKYYTGDKNHAFKLSDRDAQSMIRGWKQGEFSSYRQAGDCYGISKTLARYIIIGEKRKHLQS